MTVNKDKLDQIALSEAEYHSIVELLGRLPDDLELGLFGALWSEHCGYKHTKSLLRTLPGDSEHLLVSPGSENAGVIDIGDGLAIAFKIESHNHPSAVEPFQGAATGVGGIVRDIFAMGARPFALLNSLRFGELDGNPRQRYLLNGVVSGISWYGNCIGIPNVGGEIISDSCYDGNPLVNAMCIGLIEKGKIISAIAKQPGDLLVLVGADTGRDGIHGASGLASRVFDEDGSSRSTVQVGNPFLEKSLIEACLEVINFDGVNGMQDCGAAGLTSAAIEMADRSGLGISIDVKKIPRREENMTPYEIMLSESQERMLLAVDKGQVQEVLNLFHCKWDLDATIIGHFKRGSTVNIFDGQKSLTRTPIAPLVNGPEYSFTQKKPDWLNKLQQVDLSKRFLPKGDPHSAFLRMLGSPNIASRRPVFRQFDHHVQTNTVVEPGFDAAVLRLKGTQKGIALTTDCNGRLCYLDPRIGTQIAVAEACRNLSMVGAKAIALTDGLNFGSPENEDVQYQLNEVISGMRDAADAFDIPIVSGNASLYNESSGKAIYPTPIIGALGLIEDITRHCTYDFKNPGDLIALIGESSCWDTVEGLAGSEYQRLFGAVIAGQPKLDIDLELRLQRVCRAAINKNLLHSAHDCSIGGISVAVSQCAIRGGLGVRLYTDLPERWDAALFGETQTRVVVSLSSENLKELEQIANNETVPIKVIGHVEGEELIFGDFNINLSEATLAWENGLEKFISA